MELIHLYMEDACAGRTWVDSELPETRAFIGILLWWTGAKLVPQTGVTAQGDSDESSGDAPCMDRLLLFFEYLPLFKCDCCKVEVVVGGGYSL